MPTASERLFQFDDSVAADGTPYLAIAFGSTTPLGQWEGWLEFRPIDGDGQVVSTDRETTQPNRTDLVYWATGLSHVYLEGALRRALARNSDLKASHAATPARRAATPTAPRRASRTSTATRVQRTPVLDPFAVYAQGEEILRKELGAISPDHLRTIVDVYELEPAPSLDTGGSDRTTDGLIATIMAAVKHRTSDT